MFIQRNLSMNNKTFSIQLSNYFLKYIPSRTGYSINTIKSYRDTFIIFLKYLTEHLNIKSDKIEFSLLNRDTIEDFLSWLEIQKSYSVSSRNIRLAALHAFFRYLLLDSPEYMELCNTILAIKSKRLPLKEMNYLSIEAIKVLFSMPNINSKSGRRDLAIIALMYDSGARVQEIADLRVIDLRKNKPATVLLTGKGKKSRVIPLVQQTLNILNKYMNDYGIFSTSNETDPLFFNYNKDKLTRAGLTYILNKYVKKSMTNNKDLFPDKISPHTLRHSKAMHLLQSDVNLIYIRDFLGHSSVTTTEIYARSNPEIKRAAIEKASEKFLTKEKFSTKEKKDLFDFLKSMI